ncbi:MAG: DUF512 domain-containing protein [Dehalococcoidia bacterium]|nr:DUF512 domain-containing protein [Dehalococcoidia bacterium]
MNRPSNPMERPAALRGGLIEAVERESTADEIGLRAGDLIVAVDGRELRDAVDFRYLVAEESIELTVQRGEDEEIIALDKDPDDDLGISFVEATFDRVRICNNKCFFCFLKGLPKGLRRSLYVKDDDYRLSFAHGNFVTLTNLTEADWERLEEQRLSPLRVSVHATDLALRRLLLGNPGAPDVLAQLDRLRSLRIEAHTQVVLCPGVNDGAALDQTITDLAARYPTVQTVSIVPVGASTQAEERTPEVDGMGECTPAFASALVRQVGVHQRRTRLSSGQDVVLLSDEYYLTAGARLPAARRYGDYEQFENGIGMTRWLVEDAKSTVRRLDRSPINPTVRSGTVLTGTLVAPLLSQLFAEIEELAGVQVRVMPVNNRLFGSRINCSGLLAGDDLMDAVRNVDSDIVFVSRYSLDWSGSHFLDDTTATELQETAGRTVAFVSSISEVVELMGDQQLASRGLIVSSGPNQAGKSWTYAVDEEGERLVEPALAGPRS